MFQIKICGITSAQDAQAAVQSQADALGLNFYPQSKRFLTRENALEILQVLPETIDRVGVFVNASQDLILEYSEQFALDWIQLHGDETPDYVAKLSTELPIIKAYRLGEFGLDPLVEDLEQCRQQGRVPNAILVDAHVFGEFGGTGKQVDWNSLANWHAILDSIPLILAGGLEPSNVAQAIRIVKPTAVDTASGVEFSPGHKDPDRMNHFVNAAKNGFKS